jgi:hypothetical protein
MPIIQKAEFIQALPNSRRIKNGGLHLTCVCAYHTKNFFVEYLKLHGLHENQHYRIPTWNFTDTHTDSFYGSSFTIIFVDIETCVMAKMMWNNTADNNDQYAAW